MLDNMKLVLDNAKSITLEPNKKYDLKQFSNHYADTYFKLELKNGIYGENKTRIKNKSIDLDGIMIRNVENIVLSCISGMLWFNLIDVDGNVVASRSIKNNEELIVNETSLMTYEYNFRTVAK